MGIAKKCDQLFYKIIKRATIHVLSNEAHIYTIGYLVNIEQSTFTELAELQSEHLNTQYVQ